MLWLILESFITCRGATPRLGAAEQRQGMLHHFSLLATPKELHKVWELFRTPEYSPIGTNRMDPSHSSNHLPHMYHTHDGRGGDMMMMMVLLLLCVPFVVVGFYHNDDTTRYKLSAISPSFQGGKTAMLR